MRKPHNGFPKKRIAILLTALLFLLAAGMVLSRYIGDNQHSYTQRAESFYFSSDMLTETGVTYSIYEDTATFSLRNTADDLRVAPRDISYTVAVTGTATLSNSSGTLTGGAADSDTINLTGGEGTVTITATATAPYRKILSATLIFVNNEAKYEVVDRPTYCELILYTGDTVSPLTVNWNTTNLAPDNTNPLMAAWTDGSETLSGMTKNTSYTLIFFKNVNATYTVAKTDVVGNAITIGN